jgi:hypothetical protein
MGISQFERFFRRAASLDVDKADLEPYNDFVNHKIHDLLVRAEAIAKANTRGVILPTDLPITLGLQESIHDFRDLDEEIGLEGVLDQLGKLPPLELECSDDTRAQLPQIAGGLSVALARTFKIMEPTLRKPSTAHWQKAFLIFGQLL